MANKGPGHPKNRRNKRAGTNEAELRTFLADTLPVVRVEYDTVEPATKTSGEKMPIAIVDTTSRPDIDLEDLTRLHIFDGEGTATYSWVMVDTPTDILLKLNCDFSAPVRGQFALLLRYNTHHKLVRWIAEHEAAIPIADQRWMPGQPNKQGIVLCPDDPKFAYRLSLLRIHHLLQRKKRPLSQEEMFRIFFQVKRYLSFNELADLANVLFQIPFRGQEEQMIPNVLGDNPNAALIVQQISREFCVLMLRLLTLDGIVSGAYQEQVFFFTEDWLAEHKDELTSG